MVRLNLVTYSAVFAALSYSALAAPASAQGSPDLSAQFGQGGITSSSFARRSGTSTDSLSQLRTRSTQLQARSDKKAAAKPAAKPAAKSAPAKAAAPVTVNKTTNNNVDKSKNNNSNLSGNAGSIVNSGNQVNNDCHVASRRSVDFSPRSLDELSFHLGEQLQIERRDAALDAFNAQNAAWQQAGMQAVMGQQATINAQAATQNEAQKGKIIGGCKCNCKVGRRSITPLAVGGPQTEILQARLEGGCSLVQEPGTGRHAYVGQCARSTIDGRAIVEALQPALVL